MIVAPFSNLWLPSDNAKTMLWLDGNDPAGTGTKPANSSAVATWKDKSKNALDYTQATGANQPIYNTNYINGLGALKFNGTTRYLSCAYSALINGTGFTQYIVCKTEGNVGQFRGIHMSRVAATFNGYTFYNDSGNSYAMWFSTSGTAWDIGVTKADPGTLVLLTGNINNGSTNNLIMNGQTASDGTSTYLQNTTLPSYVGCSDSSGSPGFFFNGGICEIIHCEPRLTAYEDQQYRIYLTTKWGNGIS